MSRGPAAEMLWESVDPADALSTRFGFRESGEVVDWVANIVGDRWGLSVESPGRLVISDRNALLWFEADDQRYIAKWSANPARFAQLQRAASLVAWVAERGIPVARPIAALDGRMLVRTPRPFLLGVLPVVEGDLLDVSDPRQVADAGRMLSTLHETLADHLAEWQRDPESDRQFIHNDFRAANLLHDGTQIVAVLDFEEVTVATRAMDIGKASVLLGTRYHDWGPTTEAMRSSFVEAYNSHAAVPLSEMEKREVDRCTTATLRDFDWV